jgi:hypothetical protein
MINIRRYSELILLPTFEERYKYLKLKGSVGVETFGYERHINQILYRSKIWKQIRDEVIIRDGALDLGIEGHDISTCVVIHHMNPLTIEDLENDSPNIYDLEGLICTSTRTHRAIHFGNENVELPTLITRVKDDTCPWKGANNE